MQSSIVTIDHVDLIYQERSQETLAIQDLSFAVNEGEFVSIVGPSGCGKTTVLSLLMGLLQPTRGMVTLMGEPAGIRQSVGYMLQRDHLLDWRTVEENVLLGLTVKHMLTKERRAHALELLERYGLSEFRSHYPRALSGGMRQKVALIRTLAFDPTLLLLDEPFSALDYQTRLKLCDEMYAIIKGEHKTAILVTHDIAEAVSMSDRVLVFSDRPACLKAEHTITMDAVKTPLNRRNDPRFAGYFNIIWRELTDLGKS
ncbi:MAG: ABC transporter ATP-binding protein [Clostridia bacterium]